MPDRVIVKLKENVPDRALEALNRQNSASIEKKLPRTRVSVVKLPKELPVQAAIRRYEASPDVEYAEPDFILRPSQMTANDTDYPKLYGLNNTGQTGGTVNADIDAPEAWETTTGEAGTIVAIIDTGMDINHPDLKNNIWTNPGETAGNNKDDDGNGYVDDVNGWDFYHSDKTVYDSGDGDKHGTHVAGTIAAEGNNSVGIVGVNWRAKIMPLKFLGPNGGSTSDAVEALNYAVAKGVKISNNSWGGGGKSQTLLDAINRADTAGHLFVAAAGNDGSNNDTTPSYPSSYNSANIVSVAATDNKDALASFSNYGSTSVDLTAPGVGILSTLPEDTYGSYNGTSMATPHVSGAAALAKSNDSSLDDTGMKAKLLESVDKKSALSGKTATGGRLNAAQALVGVPTVNSTTPASGATGVARSIDVEATFSEEMNSQTIDTSTVQLYQKYWYQVRKKRNGKIRRVWTFKWVPVTADVRCDGSSTTTSCKTATLDPSSNLLASTTYMALVTTGAKDTEDTPLAENYSWTFNTGST